MLITKKDFALYLKCEKAFWLSKKDHENYPEDILTDFAKKLRDDWQEVNNYFQKTFRDEDNDTIDFQKTFETDDGLFARVSGFKINDEDETCLYEVTSSTSIKKDKKRNHLKEACFQMIVAERSKQQIDKVFIVHLDSDYKRNGDISPDGLLKFNDVTDDVRAIEQEMSNKINDALNFLSQDDIDRNGCDCIFETKGNHCNSFKYFNPHVPEESIYKLPNLRKGKKFDKLIENNVFALCDVTDEYDLSPPQEKLVLAIQSGEPQVNRAEIARILNDYQFPLYFLDYETYSSAIPLVDGASPYKSFPVQYSLHILERNGKLTHTDFLQDTARLPLNLIEQMETDFGDVGSVVVWSSFEETQNTNMAKLFCDKKDFLDDISNRIVDLLEIFKKHHLYVDAGFDGSASIKNILPVICPDNSGYGNLAVQDGTDAMLIWEKMILNPAEAEKHATDLREYCKLDTLAMVDIYKFLEELNLSP